MTITISISHENQLNVHITDNGSAGVDSQAQDLKLLELALTGFLEHEIVFTAEVGSTQENVGERIGQLLKGRTIRFAADMQQAAQAAWARDLKPSTKLILPPTTSTHTIDAIPNGVVFEILIPNNISEALLQVIADLPRESCLFLEADVSLETSHLVFAKFYPQPGHTVRLPAVMPLEIQRAIAAIVPAQCVLELGVGTSVANARSVAAVLNHRAILAVPTFMSEIGGMLVEAPTWFNEIIHDVHPSCKIKFPVGLESAVLQALVFPKEKTVILSKDIDSDALTMMMPALRSAGCTVNLARGMSPESLRALGTGRGGDGLGLQVNLHLYTSSAEAEALVSSLGDKDKVWIPSTWQPTESADEIWAECVHVAGCVAPGCSIGLLTDEQCKPHAQAKDIAQHLGDGAILRPASNMQEDILFELATALGPGRIFEISETLLSKRISACRFTTQKLRAGVILRLPHSTPYEQLRSIQIQMQPKAILELPGFKIQFLSQICEWIKTLSSDNIIALSRRFIDDIKRQYTNQFTSNIPLLTTQMEEAITQLVLTACQNVLISLVRAAEQCHLVINNIDKSMLKACEAYLPLGRSRIIGPTELPDKSNLSSNTTTPRPDSSACALEELPLVAETSLQALTSILGDDGPCSSQPLPVEGKRLRTRNKNTSFFGDTQPPAAKRTRAPRRSQ
jgi:hypothetical protein